MPVLHIKSLKAAFTLCKECKRISDSGFLLIDSGFLLVHSGFLLVDLRFLLQVVDSRFLDSGFLLIDSETLLVHLAGLPNLDSGLFTFGRTDY